MADAFGQMLLDGTGPEIIERDDGFVDAAKIGYFAPVARWPAVERRALRCAGGCLMPVWARGERLWNCSGADGASSRSMCQPVRSRSRGRGVRDVRLLAFEEVDESLGRFDTIVMFGNNFGSLARRARPCACSGGSARWRTGSWQARMTLTRRRTQPISPIRSATASGAECRASYGCVFRYRDLIGPWFDYLIVSPDEMATIVEGAQWRIRTLLEEAAAATTWPFWSRRVRA